MVSMYNQEIVRRTLSILGINMSKLFLLARKSEQPGCNSYETEQKAKKDYQLFKQGVYPDYLIRFCEKRAMQKQAESPLGNVRNLSARKGNVTDINARRNRRD